MRKKKTSAKLRTANWPAAAVLKSQSPVGGDRHSRHHQSQKTPIINTRKPCSVTKARRCLVTVISTNSVVQMEGSLAKELYGESLQLSENDLVSASAANGFDEGELEAEDGSLWGGSDDELDRESDLDREWQRRHDQFHTIGYRDGIIAGKEAAAQEGFNIGFKQSVLIGYKWGLVRGVASALACLPDGLREKLIDSEEERNKFQNLHESVNSISTGDALKLFHDEENKKKSVDAEASSNVGCLQEQSSDNRSLENYIGELQSLVSESPAIRVQFAADKHFQP